MVWMLALILMLLWLIGVLSGLTLGGFIHVLAALAGAVIVAKLVGRLAARRSRRAASRA